MAFERLTYHIVFATKDRQPLIMPQYESRVYAILGTMCKDNDVKLRIINGMPDHIHLLLDIPFKIAGSAFVRDLKSRSSRDIKLIIPNWQGWQDGFGVFTVSYSMVSTASRYIQNQKKHHLHLSSLDEYKLFLAKHGLDENSEYVK